MSTQLFSPWRGAAGSTHFLVDCAQAQAWLPLLAFAQLGGFAPAAVARVAREHVASPALRAHLHVMLGRVLRGPVDTAPAAAPVAVDHPADADTVARRDSGKRRTATFVRRSAFYSSLGFGGVPASPSDGAALPGAAGTGLPSPPIADGLCRGRWG